MSDDRMTPTAATAQVEPPATEELITVVVPAKNEEDAIVACLESIRAQDWSNLQIIVIDGDSTDATPQLVEAVGKQDSRVELLHNPRGIIPVSMNIGLRGARGRYLVRVDAHAEIPAGYVRRAAEHLQTGRWGGVGGRKVGIGRTPAGRAIAAAMESPFGVGGSYYHYGTKQRPVDHIPFGCYPVELARRLGGWDEDFLVNQDFEFDRRVREAGYELLFDPDLVIEWESRQSISALAQQYRRYGRGKAKVALTHPGSVRPSHLAAPALLAWSVGAGAAALAGRPRWAAAMMAPYAIGISAATGLSAARMPDPWEGRYLPAAFATMHYAWGLGMFEGLAREASLRLKARKRDT